MDYKETFNKRAHKYKYAIEKYPCVLEKEFQTAVEMCDIKSTDVVLNILAGGTSLNKYFIKQPQSYKQYDINCSFSELENIILCQLNKIPEDDNSIDTIITLASLHHTTNDERDMYYKECYRILKSETGKLVIGDIVESSKEAKWLNEFVNKYNSNGHNGIFFSNNDKQLIEKNGFLTETEIKSYPWIFNNENELLDFCKNLFGLDLATDKEILEGINTYLNPIRLENNILINWTLMYFISIKNQVFPQPL